MNERLTIQKQAVLDYVKSVRTHPSAENVYEAVKKKIPTISFATVYRNLNQLAKKGLIKEVCFDKSCARYDADIKDHQHFVCVECGEVHDHFGSFSALKKGLSKNGQFKVMDIDITVRGICPQCQSKLRNKK